MSSLKINMNLRPRVRPHYTIIFHDTDVVEFRHGVWHFYSVTVVDDTHSNILYRVVELLDGNKTLQEIVRVIGTNKKRQILELVERLINEGIVEPEPRIDIFQYYTTFLGTDAAKHSIKEKFKILANQSPLTDVIRNVISDEITITCFPQDLLNEINSIDLTKLDALELCTLTSKLEQYFKSVDMLLITYTSLNPIFLRNINRIAMELKVPWMISGIDGPFIMVGPTITPPEGPCYECFEMRVCLNLRNNESYLKYKKALVERKVKEGQYPIPQVILHLTSALTSLEILSRLLTGYNSTSGKVLTIYIPTMEFLYHEILKMPNCPACTSGKVGQPPYFDVKAYIDEIRRERGL